MHLFLFVSLSFVLPLVVAEVLVFLATKRTAWFTRWLRSPAEFAFAVAVATFLICGWVGMPEGLAAFLLPVEYHPGISPRLPTTLAGIAGGLWRECKVFSGMNLITGIPWGIVAAVRVYLSLRRRQRGDTL